MAVQRQEDELSKLFQLAEKHSYRLLPLVSLDQKEPELELEDYDISFIGKRLCSTIALTVNGTYSMYAHSLPLQYRSAYFRTLLTGPFSERERKHVEIELPGSYEAFRVLLNYIYSGNESVLNDLSLVCEVLELAEFLNIHDSFFTAICNLVSRENIVSNRTLQGFSTQGLELLLDKLRDFGEADVRLRAAIAHQVCENEPELTLRSQLQQTASNYFADVVLPRLTLHEIVAGKSVTELLVRDPAHLVVFPGLKVVPALLHEHEILLKRLRLESVQFECVICGRLGRGSERKKKSCERRKHTKKYKSGFDHGWKCCGAPYKKDEGCETYHTEHIWFNERSITL